MMLLAFITRAEKLVQVFLEVNFGGARTKFWQLKQPEVVGVLRGGIQNSELSRQALCPNPMRACSQAML